MAVFIYNVTLYVLHIHICTHTHIFTRDFFSYKKKYNCRDKIENDNYRYTYSFLLISMNKLILKSV